MKKTILIIITICFFGCEKKAEKIVNTSNKNIQLELLFENDGCKIYRFYDCGHQVYYTDCRGDIEYSLSKPVSKGVKYTLIKNQNIK